MKDRNGNTVSIGTKLRSIEGGVGSDIECIEITSDGSIGTFKWLITPSVIDRKHQFTLNAKNLSSSNWVIAE